MAWRMIMRRCPSRSMTVVGDIAQTGTRGGAQSWAQVLDPYAAGRWRLERLSINYRTPAEVMAVAADVLASFRPDEEPPTSVRSTGTEPWSRRVDPADLAGTLPGIVASEVTSLGDGRLAVVVPAGQVRELGDAIAAAVPGTALVDTPAALDSPAIVITATQAKGLEFDTVLVVDPAGILAESPCGGGHLYVALTRPTRRLGIVHTGDLPTVLGRLETAAAATGP